MNNLKEYSDEKIIELLKEKKITFADLTDSGICPTCFDKEHNGVVYGGSEEMAIYENDYFSCFFVGNPRADGHVAISSKKHYKDMMEIDDELCGEIFLFAKKMMNIIKEVYEAESVYLCTMCDGPMNHFHLQLIPRYKFEKRGSTNFVKDRKEFVLDKDKKEQIQNKLK